MTQEEISNHPGQIIWKQITVMTKMSCGAREAALIENGIRFKVGGKPMRFVEVTLSADDTYKVNHFRLKRNDYSRITVKNSEGVYVSELNETLYDAVNR